MTSMQAEYAKLLEASKHNRAMESLGAGELEVKVRQQSEAERANRAREYLTAAELDEKIRHDLQVETETMREFDISQTEIERYHRAQEGQWRAENDLKLTIAEMQDSRERYLAAVNNQNKVEIEKMQEQNRSAIARADRSARKAIEDARNTIEMFKANTQDAKAKAEMSKLQREIDVMSTYASNDTRRAMAAEQQAQAALRQAETASDRAEEQKRMNEWQQQVDQVHLQLEEARTRVGNVTAVVDTATKYFNERHRENMDTVEFVRDTAKDVADVGLRAAGLGRNQELKKGKWKYTG